MRSAITYMRVNGQPSGLRPFPPLVPSQVRREHLCGACGLLFEAGDITTLIPLGPGDDRQHQDKAARGETYNAVAAVVHWTCATGTVHHSGRPEWSPERFAHELVRTHEQERWPASPDLIAAQAYKQAVDDVTAAVTNTETPDAARARLRCVAVLFEFSRLLDEYFP